MLIDVTTEHIEDGKTCSPDFCPVAMAIRERTGEPIVWVSEIQVGFSIDSGDRVWLPHEAREFIYEFDNGRPVEPFSFELEIPSDY